MATPMMYEMVNAMAKSRHPYARKIADMVIERSAVAIDCGGIAQNICIPLGNGTVFLDGKYFNSLTRDGVMEGARAPFTESLIFFPWLVELTQPMAAMWMRSTTDYPYGVAERFWFYVGGGVVEKSISDPRMWLKTDVDGDPIFGSGEADSGTFGEMISKALVAINACSNAILAEQSVPRPVRRRHPHIASVKFRTVAIEAVKRANGDTRSDEELGTGVAWHKRRGHIAVYTAERPLRTPTGGAFVGKVWRSATEVGEKKNGIVVQDYVVRPPEL